jgi:hypothetical protein
LWIDSEIVIHWINSAKDLPTFVKNRVNEIIGYTNIKIGYVNTKENPADVATRGITTRQLRENLLWWNGPTCVKDKLKSWPIKSETNMNTSVAPVIFFLTSAFRSYSLKYNKLTMN